MSMWSDFDLTDRQRELVGRATELDPVFAERAPDSDREAAFPHANYQTYFMVASEIGRHCGATALTLNMHSCSMLWSGPLADDLPMTDEERRGHQERRAALYDLVLNEQAIFAQPFSEPHTQAATGKAPFGTTARNVDGGYVVNGMKHFASLAGAATHYSVLCTEERDGKDLDPKDTIMKKFPLERYYRDSRCGSLMLPWSAEACLERLGRECLYERGETD
ncbi:MAG: acyl-CoA/acyl-ACP dehydrogenase [Minwuia sp.]|nr:acyl-CoA/acyl-ACP dehydrogenase [Minwuia sp.]